MITIMNSISVKKQIFLIIILCVIILIAFQTLPTLHSIRTSYDLQKKCKQMTLENFQEKQIIFNDTSIKCFHDKKKLESLKDISDIEPRKGKSIFFHETSCRSFSLGKIYTSARQACAVESAALLNPNFDVYLLYSSPGIIKFECDESDLFLAALNYYENVKIMHVDYEKYTKNTPVEELYKSAKIDKSPYAIEHASDIIRFLTLWKYGGIYLDLDMLVLKSLENLTLNFATIESGQEIASAVLSFHPDGDGHKWAETCLNDLKNRYDSNAWSDSSVGVISRLIRNICHLNSSNFVSKDCQGYSVLPTDSFFPVFYSAWEMYFDKRDLNMILKMTNNSYGIHMWNKLSKNKKIPIKDVEVPYLYLAKKFCPNVVAACKEYF